MNVESASLGRTYVSAVDTIPEPETYVLLLAGLGLVGFIARRRKQIF
ncbi:MAG TPA: PEP-CTERM sorting domain-containing protein [Nitrosospira sp.]|nr:PEP-CTERM sorting domain-containing protein [Nitrosospira sp.]